MTQKLFGYKSKKDFKVFLLCWCAYFSTYIGRLNFSAVIPEIQKSGIWTEAQIASVSSVFFICYGIGQFISGILGDKADTRKMVFLGLFVSAVCNIGGFLWIRYPVFLLLWAVNGFAQSLVWTPILKIGSVQFDAQTVNKFGIDMSTTVPVGTLFSYGLSLLTLLFLPWRFVFLTCGLFEMLVAALWITATGHLLSAPDKAAPAEEAPAVPAASMRRTLRAVAVSGVLVMLIPIIIQGTLKDSVTQWVPAFFSNTFGSKTTFSLLLTMLLPIVNVTGAYFANALNRRMKNELSVSAVFFGIAAVFLVVLKLFGTKSMLLSLLCMAAVTNCMFAVNVMLITLVPLAFAKLGRVSTIGGALNAVAYIGCGALNLLAGKLLEGENGWPHLFLLWIVLAAAAVAVTLVIIPMWKNFQHGKTKAEKD